MQVNIARLNKDRDNKRTKERMGVNASSSSKSLSGQAWTGKKVRRAVHWEHPWLLFIADERYMPALQRSILAAGWCRRTIEQHACPTLRDVLDNIHGQPYLLIVVLNNVHGLFAVDECECVPERWIGHVACISLYPSRFCSRLQSLLPIVTIPFYPGPSRPSHVRYCTRPARQHEKKKKKRLFVD